MAGIKRINLPGTRMRDKLKLVDFSHLCLNEACDGGLFMLKRIKVSRFGLPHSVLREVGYATIYLPIMHAFNLQFDSLLVLVQRGMHEQLK